MSSFAYGFVTGKRAIAPAGKSRTTKAPAMNTYIDTLAALVPAEALALYAGIVIPYATHVSTVHGKKLTVISNPGLLEWSCAGLLALSSLLYVVGRKKTNFRPGWDVLRALIPPMAFAAWMLVQTPGVWDLWWPGSVIGERVVVATFAAVVLGILASALGNLADRSPGVPVVAGVKPASGPEGGGTSVIVTGTDLTGATGVNFGKTPAPAPTVSSDTQLTVTSPGANAPGEVDVTVTTKAGTSATSSAGKFTYTGIKPLGGPADGAHVSVTGAGSGPNEVNGGKTADPAVSGGPAAD